MSSLAPEDDDTGSLPGQPAPPIISCVNVHKTYLLGLDGVAALRGVSLDIQRGEFIVILGKSGGGKTSLLNILGTIDKPSKGELYIGGKRITSSTTDDEFAQLRLRNVGFVFQQFNLISSMTALDNVSLPMILDGRLPRDKIARRAQDLLTRVGVGARATHLPSQLSGGEQQRVTIARAISNCPEILLLDEPTGDLDTKNTHIILQLLMDLNRKEGITCIMVTHDQDLRHFAHRVVHVMDGKILRVETIPEQVRADKDAELLALIARDRKQQQDILHQRGGVTELREPMQFYSHLLSGGGAAAAGRGAAPAGGGASSSAAAAAAVGAGAGMPASNPYEMAPEGFAYGSGNGAGPGKGGFYGGAGAGAGAVAGSGRKAATNGAAHYGGSVAVLAASPSNVAGAGGAGAPIDLLSINTQ